VCADVCVRACMCVYLVCKIATVSNTGGISGCCTCTTIFSATHPATVCVCFRENCRKISEKFQRNLSYTYNRFLCNPQHTLQRTLQHTYDRVLCNPQHTLQRTLQHTYDRFLWSCYTPKIHQIEKLRFLGISRYKFKLRVWLNLNLYRGIRVSGIWWSSGVKHWNLSFIPGFGGYCIHCMYCIYIVDTTICIYILYILYIYYRYNIYTIYILYILYICLGFLVGRVGQYILHNVFKEFRFRRWLLYVIRWLLYVIRWLLYVIRITSSSHLLNLK